MAFTVEDFEDLVRALDQRPDWRDRLRQLLLPPDLLDLPTLVRELAEQVKHLAEAQQRTEAVVAGLAEAQRRTEGELAELRRSVAGLAEVQQRMVTEFAELRRDVNGLTREQATMRDHLADLRSSRYERRYRDHASGHFGSLLRRPRVVDPDELDDLLDEGLAAGILDEAAARDVRLADLILRGRRPSEEGDSYLVVEVSAMLDSDDVERASRRAGILGRLRPTLAVIAGGGLTPAAAKLARAQTVWLVEDGRSHPPNLP